MSNKLKQFAANVHSQFGEDGIICKIFEILPEQEEYWCVEFGAWDGKKYSNTYELISNKNWHGVLIEGNNTKFLELQNTYEHNNKAILINKFVDFQGGNTLDNILKGTKVPVEFDLLSIDIDGNDYHVWNSVVKYTPKLVIVEFNPTIPSDIEFIQEKDFFLNHGNSLLAFNNLANTKGYELIATTECNGFFIKKEFFELFEIEDNSINNIWDTQNKTPRIFQLYDGTLVLDQEFKLQWRKTFVERFDLQILPKIQRRFGDSQSQNTATYNNPNILSQKPNRLKKIVLALLRKVKK